MSQEKWTPFQNIHQKVPQKVVNHQINGYAQSNDYTQFAIYGRDSIYLIDFQTNYVLFKYDCYTRKWNLKYSEDSQWLLNSGMQTIYLINSQFPKQSKQKSVSHKNAEFTKDSKFLVIFSWNAITIENIISNEIVQTIKNANINPYIFLNYGAIVKENSVYHSKFKILQHNQSQNYSKRIESLDFCSNNQLVILLSSDFIGKTKKIYVRNICRDKLLRKFTEGKPLAEYTSKQNHGEIKKTVYIFDIATGDDADKYEYSKYLPQLWRNNHMIKLHERKHLDQVIKYKQHGMSQVSIALMTFDQPVKIQYHNNYNYDEEYYGSDDSMEYYMHLNDYDYDDDDSDFD